jgi:hypothetical protein
VAALPDPQQSVFPESNVEALLTILWPGPFDLDGDGLVRMLRLLTARAEQIKAISIRLTEFDCGLGKRVPEQSEFKAAILEGVYDTTCLKWFLSRAFKQLAEDLEYVVYEKQTQNQVHRIQSIIYNSEGELESYSLDKT